MDAKQKKMMVTAARNEITEYHIYLKTARREKNPRNRELLEKIAAQEKEHYLYWCQKLGREIRPSRIKIAFYSLLVRLFGLSFSLKLMEKGENLAQELYRQLGSSEPKAMEMFADEQKHEEHLLSLINEKHLQYVSSFVLGLNDALVELTGALAGLTLALQNTRLIAAVGLITGIAASMAMAASEYLSTREEKGKSPLRAGGVTGIAYILTVFLLISPYLFLENPFAALSGTLGMAVVVILLFTYYTATAKGISFRKKFLEMAAISFSVAAINFGIGYAIREYFGI